MVRAKTILGEEISETVTNIYFFNKNYTLPIVNLNLDDDLLFGYENGLFVAEKVFDQWRENNPSLETNLWTPANYDWPQNNNEYFRKRVNYSPNAPYAQDGRFRWVMKDLDVSFNGMQDWIRDSYRFNMIKHALDNTLSSEDYKNDILHGFFKNETFKTDFINRFADLLNTTYQPDYMIGLMNQMKSVLEPEIEKQIIRWNLIESKEQWEDNIAVMVNFAEQRPTFQKQHIIDYFELSGEYELTAETSDKNQGFIKVNTIEINNSTVGINDNYEQWKGFYFKVFRKKPFRLNTRLLCGLSKIVK